MEISANQLKLKVHDEVVLYRTQAAGDSDGALGCFHISSGVLVEQRLASPADPADLQVTQVTPRELSVVLRDPAGREVTVESQPNLDRCRAVTTALVSGLARAVLKAEQAAAAAASVPVARPLGRVGGARRPPAKRPPGRSIVNPSARKRATASGVSFESDSQE